MLSNRTINGWNKIDAFSKRFYIKSGSPDHHNGIVNTEHRRSRKDRCGSAGDRLLAHRASCPDDGRERPRHRLGLQDRQVRETFAGHEDRVLGIAFASDGQTVYTCSLDGAIFAWDLGGKRRFGRPFQVPAASVMNYDTSTLPPLAISGDGSAFATACGRSRSASSRSRRCASGERSP